MNAFMTSDSYKGEGWTAETDAPRDASSGVSPHDQVIVYLNDVLVASQAAGNGGIGAASGVPHPAGSMAVKEMYDESGARVGVAAMFKGADGGNETWTFYCHGPGERCGSGVGSPTVEDPVFETNLLLCGACHGGNVFTSLTEE